MKKIITALLLITTIGLNAQLVVDDFKTGTFNNTTFKSGESQHIFQTGNGIIGKTRRVHAKINQNPYDQNFQVTVNQGAMVMTAAYDTRGTVYVGYGHDKNGNQPMNLNVSKYKNLKIEFVGKSTVNGMYVSLFTGTSRGVYSSHVPAREGKFVFTVPLTDIKKVGPNYTLKDIDHIRLQFDSRSKTGCNMAINKIWFE